MKTVFKLALSLFAASCLTMPTYAELQLRALTLPEMGKIAQFTLTEQGELIVINQRGELWQTTPSRKLAEHLSPQISPSAAYGRIAAADAQGHFLLWTPEKTYHSDIPLAQHATLLPLAFATIAVSHQPDGYRLVRIETHGNRATVVARSDDEVLPDARPRQVNFDHADHRQGHIAVLAKPDAHTYQHGVLGDAIEARELQYLERHTLKPLASGLSVKGLVFEANQTEILNAQTPKLIAVMSGQGEGGRAVLIGQSQGKLQIEAQSEPLANHRWQSPFSFNHTLYSVQMPHLIGRLVKYQHISNTLHETVLETGLSNHAYGEYETNLATATEHFAIIPSRDYRQLFALDKQGKLTALTPTLPTTVHQTKSSANKAYLLLSDGSMWVAETK